MSVDHLSYYYGCGLHKIFGCSCTYLGMTTVTNSVFPPPLPGKEPPRTLPLASCWICDDDDDVLLATVGG